MLCSGSQAFLSQRLLSCEGFLSEALEVMTEFWLISVPLDKTSLTSVEKLKRTITKTHLASCWRFSIPDLKVRVCNYITEEPEDALN